MGMFDRLRVERKLPFKEMQNCIFQTKDLDNALDNFVITKHGLLKNDETGKRVRYTGELRFYDFWRIGGENVLVDFVATLNDGKCNNIQCVSQEAITYLEAQQLKKSILKKSRKSARTTKSTSTIGL